jgi:hypothetical protein
MHDDLEVLEMLRALIHSEGDPGVFCEGTKISFRWIRGDVVHDFEFDLLSGYIYNRYTNEMEWEWSG